MQDLFTDAAARGRGIAAALIAAVCEAARREGADRSLIRANGATG